MDVLSYLLFTLFWKMSFGKSPNSGSACILDLNKDLTKNNEPLFLKQTYDSLDLLLPEVNGKDGQIELKKGEKMIISCPGKKNYITLFNTQRVEGSCVGGTKLMVEGRDLPADQLDCRGKVTAASRGSGARCAGGKGVVVELGFDVGNWITLVQSCHNVEESHTYYSRHVINGAAIEGKIRRRTTRPKFSNDDPDFFLGFDPEISYTKDKQKSVFLAKLGRGSDQRYLGPRNSYLARGHLAPDADFVFSAHQFATYFFVNASPQWQSINGGNWYSLESKIRSLAKRLKIDLEVVTGTEGVLKLEGKDGIEKEITLQDSRLPVPRHFWKIVRNPRDNSCIAFIATNNPFLTQPPATICTDICAQNGWPLLQNDIPKGYIYCCQYNAMRDAIPEVPQLYCRSVIEWVP